MAIKFSQFVVETSASTMSHIVGYNGADNIQITPENFFTSFATGSSTDISYFSGSSILKGDSTTPFVYIDDTNTGGQPVGRMGLGTSSPNFKLDIAGGDLRMESNNGIRFGGTGSNNTNWRIFTTGTSTGSLSIGNSSSTPYLTISRGSSTTGFVGIGTSSPGTTLDVVGTLASSGITQLGTGGSNVLLTSSGGGNVGIGTSSPSTKLHVFEEGTSMITVDSGSGSPYKAGIEFLRSSINGGSIYNDGNNVQIKFDSYFGYDSANPTRGGFQFRTAPVSNNTMVDAVRIDALGNVGIGTSSPARKLQVEGGDFYTNDKSDTAGASVGYGGNSFQIRNGTTSEDLNFDIFNRTTSAWGTPLIIKNTGNVGIGTTSPSKKLEVVGDIKTSGTGNTQVILESGGACVMDLINAQSEAYLRTTTAHDLHFRTTNLNRMVIKAAGNVGIGTTSPASKLEVDGGDIEVDDSASGLILRSPDGTRYRVTVANGGTLSVSAV
jgi:hypothetical protein